jgi:hypothetical protein
VTQPSYPPCDHAHKSDNPYRCADCGVQLCTGCAGEVHWRATAHPYCRDCAEKAGHGYQFQVVVDVDLVLEQFAGDQEKTTKFLEECKGYRFVEG